MSRSDKQFAGPFRSTSPCWQEDASKQTCVTGEHKLLIPIEDAQGSAPNLRGEVLTTRDLKQAVRNHDRNSQTFETPNQRELSHPAAVNERLDQRRFANSNFQEDDAYHEKKLRRKRFHYTLYQDLHMLSRYQEDEFTLALASTQKGEDMLENAHVQRSTDWWCSEDETVASPSPKMPLEHYTFNGDPISPPQSPERKPLHTKLLVENEVEVCDGSARMAGERCEEQLQQLQVPVLARRGRPKIIDICRLVPADQAIDHPTHEQTHFQLQTPLKKDGDVSVFGPLDTPISGTPFSNLSRTASGATPVPRRQVALCVNTNLVSMLQSKPTLPASRRSTRSFDPSNSPLGSVGKRLADPFYSPVSGAFECASGGATSSVQSSPPQPTRSSTRATQNVSGTSSWTSIRSAGNLECKLRDAIAATQILLTEGPEKALSMADDELGHFRSRRLDGGFESIMISTLNNVFPQAPHATLSTLLAWLTVDRHYTRLFDTAPSDIPPNADDFYFAGMHSHLNGSPHHATSIQCSWTESPEIVPQVPAVAGISPPSISSPLCAGTIPSKAASVLGLHADPTGTTRQAPSQGSWPRQKQTDEAYARTVHGRVQDMGRSIVKTMISSPSPMSGTNASRPKRLTAHMSGKRAAVAESSSTGDETVQRAVESLWQACRCLVAGM